MRLKLIAANLVTVLVLGIVAYFLVEGFYADVFGSEIAAELDRDREVLERSSLLASRQYVDRVAQRATIPEVLNVYAQTDRVARRAKASGEADAFVKALGRPEKGGREPEFVALTDVRGNVISRNLNPNVDVNRPLGEQFQSLSFALNGTSGRDIWLYDGTMLDVAFAPVRREGQVVGALVTGFDVSNGVAEENSRLLNAEIVYFIAGRVYSSSLGSATLRSELATHIFEGPAKALVAKALQVRRVSEPFEVRLGKADYLAQAGPLPGQITSRDSGYVILSSLTAAMAPVSGARRVLWITVPAALLAVVIGFVLGGLLLKPVEQIEEGVLRMINGDTRHRIEVESADLGGLAYRINQLVGGLTGESEEDEEGMDAATVAELDKPRGG